MVDYRREYEMLLEKYPENVRLSQSTLIIAQGISGTSNTYKFPVTIQDGQPILPGEEIRLDINDEFVVLEQGFYLRAVLVNTVAPFQESPVYLTCSPFELDGTAMTFEKLYSGRFNISVNNIVYMQNWDVRKHEYRGITQIKSFSAGIPNATFYANNMSENGMVSVLPTITLSGATKNDLQLTLPFAIDNAPASLPFISANGVQINVIIKELMYVARGFLAQNAARFQGSGKA